MRTGSGSGESGGGPSFCRPVQTRARSAAIAALADGSPPRGLRPPQPHCRLGARPRRGVAASACAVRSAHPTARGHQWRSPPLCRHERAAPAARAADTARMVYDLWRGGRTPPGISFMGRRRDEARRRCGASWNHASAPRGPGGWQRAPANGPVGGGAAVAGAAVAGGAPHRRCASAGGGGGAGTGLMHPSLVDERVTGRREGDACWRRGARRARRWGGAKGQSTKTSTTGDPRGSNGSRCGKFWWWAHSTPSSTTPPESTHWPECADLRNSSSSRSREPLGALHGSNRPEARRLPSPRPAVVRCALAARRSGRPAVPPLAARDGVGSAVGCGRGPVKIAKLGGACRTGP